jgi:hypothetical protein
MMGEAAYVGLKQREALSFIMEYPTEYLRFVAFRIRYWWIAEGESASLFLLYAALGLGSLARILLSWHKGNTAVRLMAIVTVVYPAVYYLTNVYARYWHPSGADNDDFCDVCLLLAGREASGTDSHKVRKSAPVKAEPSSPGPPTLSLTCSRL